MADSILRLRVDSTEYNNKLKQATNGLTRYVDECRKVGGTLEVVEKETLDYVRAIGQMDTTSRTATGKLAEMKKTFVELSAQYKQMSDAEKNAPFGKTLSQSLDQLKVRISDSKKQLEDINREINGGSKLGQFGGMIDTLGQKMGMTGNITEMLISKTALLTGAIGAGIAIVTKSTEAWAAYNSELAKQDQTTTVTTGLNGADADRMTDSVRAMVDTYNVDFRTAINAANTIMSQFGETGDSAIKLLKDGMQGMIHGDGPKLLQMIQQFAPAFRDAGVSASQLVAVIQNSEGGLFTDQNMNAIVMGIKNIRLMTKATSDALAQLGIDGQKMSQQLSDGSLTVFDALKQVAGAISNVDSNSKAAGEVMQQVFGRQGVSAGTNLGKAIELLNTNLEETKRQTGEVGEAFAELQKANEKLNIAIRDAFSYDGWEQMATGIRSSLITALATVIEQLGNIRALLTGMPMPSQIKGANGDRKALVDNMLSGLKASEVKSIQNRVNEATFDKEINRRQQAVNAWNEWRSAGHGGLTADQIGKIRDEFGTNTKAINDEIKAWQQAKADYQKAAAEILNTKGETKTKDPIINPTKPTGGKKTPEYIPLEGSIDAQTKKVQDLQKAWRAAADDTSREEIKKQIDEAQFALDKMLGKVKERPKMEAVDMKAIAPNGGIGSLIQDTFTRQQQGLTELKQKVKLELDQEAMKADTETLKTILKDSIQNGIEGMDFQLMGIGDEIAKGFNIPNEKWNEIIEQYNAKLKEKGLGPLNIDLITGKTDTNTGKGVKASDELSKINQDVSKITSGIGGIFSGIQQMGIEIPEGISEMLGVLQGITTIMTAITTILSVIEATSSVTAATSAVKAIPVVGWLMANGGVVHAEGGYKVPGNHMSGDMVPAMLNSGELVLNKAQQGNLASQLKDGEGRGGYTPSHISGEQIWIALNRYTKRTGRGEMVTWK